MGLERVAEELMGRRKWKLYQEVLARSQLNVNAANLVQNSTPDQSSRLDCFEPPEKLKLALPIQPQTLAENHLKENEVVTIKNEISENTDEKGCAVSEKGNLGERLSDDLVGNSGISITNTQEVVEEKSESPGPIDWKPTDKCYFCVDGKLLTVNDRGDLVAESGPAQSEAELANRASLDSDSDSSDSSPEIEVQTHTGNNASKSVTSIPPNMTSLESMAVHLAAVAQIQGIQPITSFYPGLWYHQLAQQVPPATPTTSETNVAALSPSTKESPSPSDITGEQPLDLSAKPSPNSSMSGSGDPKQVFRAKPRVSAVTGRRTYTEDELHSALKDIISGKLGTRRAAVLYGIPRSTLRNKVYKIAMDQKRQASALHQPVLADLVDQDDEDKESGDDEKEDKILSSSLDDQVDDLTRFTTSHLAAAALQKISKVCENNQVDVKPQIAMDSTHKHLQTTSQPQKPPITPHPWFDPNVILQSLLLRGIPGLMQPKEDQSAAIPELIKNFILQQQELIKEQMKNSASAATNDIMNNGKANIPDPRLLMQSLSMQQHGSQQHHIHTGHHYPNRTRNSETPEMSSSADMSETSDDPSVILKIPSYKPVAGSSSGRNGDGLCSPAPQATPPILSRSPHQPNSLPGISPPLIRHNSDSQSPPIIGGKGILSLGEVIAKSISRTFNQQANQESNLGTHQSVSEHNDQYKRPSISIKNLGIAEFGATPNILGNNSSNSSGSQGQSSSSGGGKGTRPKRGKYRNYDRDSLVEAVKAVQRGEMSVHRAGSYYGVPHSTLEYKVKERHLMRPRKREPKPQPLDDRATGCASSSTNSKNTNIPGIAGSIDKIKSAAVAQSKVHKNNPPFPSTSPNGMKVPMFDPAMGAQLPYPTHLFWPSHSTGFGSLPIDFTRTPGGAPGAAASAAATVGFPSNAENFLASHMMQRFHEDTNRHSANSSNLNSSNSSTAAVATATPTTLATTNNKAGLNNAAASSGKSTRELAESLYDTGGANGSFLDGIIRQTLERSTSNDASHTVLLDQRVKTTRLPASGSDSSSCPTLKGSKRSVSPMHFPVIDIKRERSSPNLNLSSSDAEISSRERDISQESVESLLKMRDGLTLKMEDKQLLHQQQQSLLHHHQNLHQHHVQQQQQQSQPLHLHHQQSASSNSRHISLEDINGSGCGLHEKLGQIKSEAEDSL